MNWANRHTNRLSQNPKLFFNNRIDHRGLTKNQRKRINKKANKQLI